MSKRIKPTTIAKVVKESQRFTKKLNEFDIFQRRQEVSEKKNCL